MTSYLINLFIFVIVLGITTANGNNGNVYENQNGNCENTRGFHANCNVYCPYGKATDENGCTLGCACREPEPGECPRLPCNGNGNSGAGENCPNGRLKDKDGCEICECAPSNTSSQPAPSTRAFITTEPSTTRPKVTTSTSRNQTVMCDVNIQFTINCIGNFACPYGYETDENGCQISCKCGERGPGECPSYLPCTNKNRGPGVNCPYGRVKDKDGCEICQCADRSTAVSASTTSVKPGECPQLGYGFISYYGRHATCRGDDYRCPGVEKCCNIRYKFYVCITPVSNVNKW